MISNAFVRVLERAPKDVELYRVEERTKDTLDGLLGGSEKVSAPCALALGQEGFMYLLRAYGSD